MTSGFAYSWFPEVGVFEDCLKGMVCDIKKIYLSSKDIVGYLIDRSPFMAKRAFSAFKCYLGSCLSDLERRFNGLFDKSQEDVSDRPSGDADGERSPKREMRPDNSSLEDVVGLHDSDYCRSARCASDLYNQGLPARHIYSELTKRGVDVYCYDDLAKIVADGISLGSKYLRPRYDHVISGYLGANEKVIEDYASGRSYAEIRAEFFERTHGMRISDSSIGRLISKHAFMHDSGIYSMHRHNMRKRP